jgi:hypothetical protein
VNKFCQEVQDLKFKVIDQNNQIYVEDLLKVRQEFFTGQAKQLFKSIAINKHLKAILNWCFQLMSYILSKEGKETDVFTQCTDMVSELSNNAASMVDLSSNKLSK